MKLITFILFLFLTSNLYPCKCDDIPTVKESVKYADIVFSGLVISKINTTDYRSKIISVGDTTNVYHRMTYYPMSIVKIKLTKIYKGQTTADTITIITGPNSASCGYNFRVGENYIIYGYVNNKIISTQNYSIKTKDKNTYWTHQCSRTELYSLQEEEDIISAPK